MYTTVGTLDVPSVGQQPAPVTKLNIVASIQEWDKSPRRSTAASVTLETCPIRVWRQRYYTTKNVHLLEVLIFFFNIYTYLLKRLSLIFGL